MLSWAPSWWPQKGPARDLGKVVMRSNLIAHPFTYLQLFTKTTGCFFPPKKALRDTGRGVLCVSMFPCYV